MAAFIIAGIIALCTLGFAVLQLFAAGMSDAVYAERDAKSEIVFTLSVGLSLAALIAASHWLPHIGW